MNEVTSNQKIAEELGRFFDWDADSQQVFEVNAALDAKDKELRKAVDDVLSELAQKMFDVRCDCKGGEGGEGCDKCAVKSCPHGAIEHFWHDGCPSCVSCDGKCNGCVALKSATEDIFGNTEDIIKETFDTLITKPL